MVTPRPTGRSFDRQTTKHADDGTQVGTLLDQIDDPIASFTGDGAFRCLV